MFNSPFIYSHEVTSITDVWCRVFEDTSMETMREKLEIIRPLVALSSYEDIVVFNHWAQKSGVSLIVR